MPYRKENNWREFAYRFSPKTNKYIETEKTQWRWLYNLVLNVYVIHNSITHFSINNLGLNVSSSPLLDSQEAQHSIINNFMQVLLCFYFKNIMLFTFIFVKWASYSISITISFLSLATDLLQDYLNQCILQQVKIYTQISFMTLNLFRSVMISQENLWKISFLFFYDQYLTLL